MKVLWTIFLLGVAAYAAPALAEPLTLAQVEELHGFLECRLPCDYGKASAREACMASCPKEDSRWDKNLDKAVDSTDAYLAMAEYMDHGSQTHICYDNDGRVLPKAACGIESCKRDHSDAECADADKDGVRAWEEARLGSSDTAAQKVCTQNVDCGGFTTQCTYAESAARQVCVPRECGSSCTAFHLEEVSQDDQEVIAHVYFDYAPVPVTVLNLYIKIGKGNGKELELVDSRPLRSLKDAGKELTVSRVRSTGNLRLIALGTASKAPIQPGPIAELVLKRNSSVATELAFSTSTTLRHDAFAPYPGAAANKELTDSSTLWGKNVNVAAASSTGRRLALYYTFDDERHTENQVAVASAEALCGDLPGCRNETDELKRQKQVARLTALQRGTTFVDQFVDGVVGKAARFDGHADHLELPLVLNRANSDDSLGRYQMSDQSYSFSTWFFADDDGRASSEAGQLLFSHNRPVEETAYGLLLVPGDSASTRDLVWFTGDVRSRSVTTQNVADELPVRRWTHVGAAVDAVQRRAFVYVDGEQKATVSFAGAAVACPQFDANGVLQLRAQGGEEDALRSAPPEGLFVSTSNGVKARIERIDPASGTRVPLIADANVAAEDPDYSPVHDALLYSALTADGDREIFLARGDGSQPIQLTKGFGEHTTGVVARRPRWSPNGSFFVFESNAFSRASKDNVEQATDLYLVPFDARAPALVVYAERLADGTLRDLRLTGARPGTARDPEAPVEFVNALWLAKTASRAQYKAELLVTGVFRSGARKGFRIRIPEAGAPERLLEAPSLPGGQGARDNLEPLAALRSQSPGEVQARERVLWARTRVIERTLESGAPFVLDSKSEGGEVELTVRVATQAFASDCWDRDRNGAASPGEDRDGNKTLDTNDCYPSDVEDLMVAFDQAAVQPVVDAQGAVSFTTGVDANKVARASWVHGRDGEHLQISVRSPTSIKPIPAETVIAKLRFRAREGGVPGFALRKHTRERDLFVSEGSDVQRLDVNPQHFSLVEAAAFSPDGQRLALFGMHEGRPVLALTRKLWSEQGQEGPLSTSGLEMLSEMPEQIAGIAFRKLERFYPCNWFGAHRDRESGRYVTAFVGGLDELKVHNYVRGGKAFASDAARGHDTLDALSGGATIRDESRACRADLECPTHELCVGATSTSAGQCRVETCDPSKPRSCSRGTCTLLPLHTAQGNAGSWVCSVECTSDNQCFQQLCANGPCLFCAQGGQTCGECRDTVRSESGLAFAVTEGCPDQNRFMCDQGTCASECYDLSDNQSRFLCDPALEYCHKGRCTALDWEWEDLSPATFSGLGMMVRASEPPTVARSQLYPLEIFAHGTEDYLHSPELRVEGKVGEDGEWFELGLVAVHNKCAAEASDPSLAYTLQTSRPITHVRLSLATSLPGSLDAVRQGAAENRCARGSREGGYPVGVDLRAFGRTHPACRGALSQVLAGEPAVVVSRLRFLGNDVDVTARPLSCDGRKASTSYVYGGLSPVAGYNPTFVNENANGCFAGGESQQPCYEWEGGDVSLDYLNSSAQPFRTLDFEEFHSFGYDPPSSSIQ